MSFWTLSLGVPSRLYFGPTGALKASRRPPPPLPTSNSLVFTRFIYKSILIQNQSGVSIDFFKKWYIFNSFLITYFTFAQIRQCWKVHVSVRTDSVFPCLVYCRTIHVRVQVSISTERCNYYFQEAPWRYFIGLVSIEQNLV